MWSNSGEEEGSRTCLLPDILGPALMLTKAGIDTAIFKTHSVRGAATTVASNAGVTTCDIPNAAD